jgi:hypothetical protein
MMGAQTIESMMRNSFNNVLAEIPTRRSSQLERAEEFPEDNYRIVLDEDVFIEDQII